MDVLLIENGYIDVFLGVGKGIAQKEGAMAGMTEEEWRHLYKHFETTWLFTAVDKVDELRGMLAWAS